MLPEVSALEPKLKEILYGCLEEIRATKAALYLSASANFNEAIYELSTQYGFGEVARRQIDGKDVVVDRISVRRSAFFVNGLASEPRFSELLYAAGTDRLLIAPIFARGRLVGFVDIRDKVGKEPFGPNDVGVAKKLTDRFLELLVHRNVYGLGPIQVSAVEVTHEDAAAIAPSTLRAIEQARAAVGRELTRPRTAATLGEAELAAIRDSLAGVLAIPGAVAAIVTAVGHMNNIQLLAARSTMTPDAVEQLQAKINAWIRRRGEPELRFHTEVFHPLGTSAPPINAARLVSVLTAPIATPVSGLVFSVAFETRPEAEARRFLDMFLHHVEKTIEHATADSAFRNTRDQIAAKLLEPDFASNPELVQHSRRVSTLATRFAESLALSPSQIETIRLAALVHDVGLRVLDYPYRKKALDIEERKYLRDHPVIGAALVEPLLGAEIANIVLTHHERVDGKGYPHGLAREEIPLAARVLQICDAFLAMTVLGSYQPPIPERAAFEQLRQNAGSQFDAELVEKFITMQSREEEWVGDGEEWGVGGDE